MKRLFIIFFSIFPFIGFSQLSTLATRKFLLPVNSEYLPNTIIVKYRAAGRPGKKSSSVSAKLNVEANKLKVKCATITSMVPKFRSLIAGQANTSAVNNLSNIYELRYTGHAPIEVVINELLTDARIEYAEPSYIFHSDAVPNDLYLLSSKTYLDQIKAPQAWDISSQAPGIIIAIIDSGSDINHQDLFSNIYLNSQDPINGIDDDHDGYIDNYYGWDFAGATSATMAEDNDPNVKSRNSEHGVHVSGLASAVSNNGIGVASLAGSAKLLIVKAAADDNRANIYKGYEGIKYAADHGANIINCSWGGRVALSLVVT